jgi:putative membrane protein
VSRAVVVAVLLAVAAAYVTGWLRLSPRAPAHPPRAWRLAAAMAALAALAVALASPLDTLAHERFVAHMVQHLLLMTVAAPLVLLADPFPIVLWALPACARTALQPLFARGGAIRRILGLLTSMPLAWLLFATTVWLWHLPVLYERALNDGRVHALEHFAFFGAALVFWWPVLDPAPRVRRPAHPGAAIVYVVLAAFQSAALGLALMLWPSVLYPSYATAGASPLDDQAWGGILMWAVSAVVDMAVVMALVWRYLEHEGPRHGPPNPPKRSSRPGKAVALLDTPTGSSPSTSARGQRGRAVVSQFEIRAGGHLKTTP